MTDKSFIEHDDAGEVDTSLLQRIVDHMTLGHYDRVARLFGADVGPRPEDDEPVGVSDLPRFGEEPTAPENEKVPHEPHRVDR